MRILLLLFFAVFVCSEKSFEEKLREGNQLLKNEPHADDTMEFLKKLRSMEKEIEEEYFAKPNAEEMKAMEASTWSHVWTEQADKILEDITNNKGNRKKRQAYRDENYPKFLWSNGVNFAFHNSTSVARRVFTRAAAMWSWDTCINFGETDRAKDKIVVVKSEGCWSYIGRIGGSQALSLGAGCESV
uniref:Astacin domain-containing protein n=1 Tax=Angiostrongylus cantonensis TaxID=6313 RepID=A0A0K0DKG2_ANGCA